MKKILSNHTLESLGFVGIGFDKFEIADLTENYKKIYYQKILRDVENSALGEIFRSYFQNFLKTIFPMNFFNTFFVGKE